MKRDGTTNEHLKALIEDLKRQSYSQEADIWRRIAVDLERPARQRRIVNLSRINRFTSEGESIIIPGKVLGSGSISHSVVVAALSFSGSARELIEKAKGKCLTIHELARQNPKGKNVRIIG